MSVVRGSKRPADSANHEGYNRADEQPEMTTLLDDEGNLASQNALGSDLKSLGHRRNKRMRHWVNTSRTTADQPTAGTAQSCSSDGSSTIPITEADAKSSNPSPDLLNIGYGTSADIEISNGSCANGIQAGDVCEGPSTLQEALAMIAHLQQENTDLRRANDRLVQFDKAMSDKLRDMN